MFTMTRRIWGRLESAAILEPCEKELDNLEAMHAAKTATLVAKVQLLPCPREVATVNNSRTSSFFPWPATVVWLVHGVLVGPCSKRRRWFGPPPPKKVARTPVPLHDRRKEAPPSFRILHKLFFR